MFESLLGAVSGISYGANWARNIGHTEVDVFTGDNAVAAAWPAWRQLELSRAPSTPFQTYAFAEAVADAHRRKGETPRIVVVYDQGRPVLLFPTVVGRFCGVPTIRFLGDPLIQYGDVLASPTATPAHYASAWRSLMDQAVARVIQLRMVRDDALVAPFLRTVTSTIGTTDAPFIDLNAVSTPSIRHASRVRRHRRRLEKRGKLELQVLTGAEAKPVLAAALDYKRSWLAERNYSSAVLGDPDWEDALTRLAQCASPGFQLVAVQLCVGGAPAAIEIAFSDGRRWCSFLGAITPEFAGVGPGNVQIEDTIAACTASNHAIYDLLAPPEPFKCEIATGRISVNNHIKAIGVRGRLVLAATRLAPQIKSQVMRLPPRPRGTIVRWVRALTST